MKKFKYKEGEKLLLEVEVTNVYWFSNRYELGIGNKARIGIDKEELENLMNHNAFRLKVPQFVVEYFLENKNNFDSYEEWLSSDNLPKNIKSWLYDNNKKTNLKNFHSLSKLITFGVVGVIVEENKKYKVRMLGIDTGNILVHHKPTKKYFWSDGDGNIEEYTELHTKKELEEAGFGNMFENPMFEIS